ncbi:hypothetical protein [Novipirellula herctigrandis]
MLQSENVMGDRLLAALEHMEQGSDGVFDSLDRFLRKKAIKQLASRAGRYCGGGGNWMNDPDAVND